ncbi:MAG: SLC13 family permease [Deltaproteobacteria bacterium]|nr:SLC13 family permease [Deltaproteobacteria bacterium]
MTADAWITLAVVAATVAVMAADLAGPDMVLVAALTILVGAGVLSPEDAFRGFGHPAVITIAALYIVAAGVRQTGGLDWVARRALGRPPTRGRAQLRLMLPVGALSAFLNNTPVVAMFIPLVRDWARRSGLNVRDLLMPLSYASILGGTCTLIGTSTNLVVAGLYSARAGGAEIGLFDISWIGLPVFVVGIFSVVLLSRGLSKGKPKPTSRREEMREYTLSLRVERGSPVVGQTIEEAGLRSLDKLYLYEIERDGHVLPAVPPSTRLYADDKLRFTGILDSAVDLRKMRLVPETEEARRLEGKSERRWVEAVVAPQSVLEGSTIRAAAFRTHFNAAVIAVHRQGERVPAKIGDIVLRAGDVLLLETHPRFVEKYRHDPSFALVALVEGSTPPRHEKAWLAMLILVAMVAVNVAGLLPLLTAALAAAAAMLITRCLSGQEARQSLELRVLVAVAAALGLGVALERSGAAATLGDTILGLAIPLGPVGLLAVIYATTALLAGAVTTTTSAALMFPVAAAACASVPELPLLPTALIVAVAASTAFSTPTGYQTNLMVYGPGGYRYRDFLEVGLPLQAIVGTVAVTMAWLIYL